MPPPGILKFKRARSNRWLAVDPILDAAEPGFELDTGLVKIGNGVSRWSELDYFVPVDPSVVEDDNLPDHIASETPHPNYDDGRNFFVLYENAKV